MAATVNTGWKSVTPGECSECGLDDEWECDGRGMILCSCQGCPYCGLVSAEGFHEQGCEALLTEEDVELALADQEEWESRNT